MPEPRGGCTLTKTSQADTYLVMAGADRQPKEFNDVWLLKVRCFIIKIIANEGEEVKFGWK